MGFRGPERKDFVFIVDLLGVKERVWEKVMCQWDLDHEKVTGTKTGLMHVVTGRLRKNWRAWAEAQASREKLQWIKQGYPMNYLGPVPPASCRSNHKGCKTEEYTAWFFVSLEEMLVLRTAVEIGHKAYHCSPLNIVEKLGFDAVANPDRL